MDADGVEPSLNARITAWQFHNANTKMRLYAQAIFTPVPPAQTSPGVFLLWFILHVNIARNEVLY